MLSNTTWVQCFKYTDKSNDCGQGQEPTLEWSIRKFLHSSRLQPSSQTLD